MRQMQILLVDDSQQNRVLIRAILEAEGFEVTEAATGEEAVAMAATGSFDLVLLDLVLPGIDGFAVLKALKGEPHSGEVPVLVMSALGEDTARVRAIEMGAADYLIRPAGRAELVARVRGLLRAKVLQERLDDSFNKLTALGRTSEIHLSELQATGALVSDPLPNLVEQIRAASKVGRDPDIIAAFVRQGEGFQGRVFLGSMEQLPVSMPAPESLIVSSAISRTEVGIWNGGQEDSNPWIPILREAIGAEDDPVHNLAWCVTPTRVLAAANYPGGADAFDGEVVRGFALHWEFVDRVVAAGRDIKEAFEYTVGALSRAAEANDPLVGAHLCRVNAYSSELAELLGMPTSFVNAIHVQAQLHDVGKLQIPLTLLNKPGDLTAAEYEILQKHTTYGAHILGDHPRLKMAATIALTHHERWDGTGYPRGLKGEGIPLEGRIVKLADVYDALRCERPYKAALSHRFAVEVITRGDGRILPEHFDPALMDAFRRATPRFSEIHEQLSRGRTV
jgi:response regulator RpfG family c-di-GMP phosphodiesterase